MYEYYNICNFTGIIMANDTVNGTVEMKYEAPGEIEEEKTKTFLKLYHFRSTYIQARNLFGCTLCFKQYPHALYAYFYPCVVSGDKMIYMEGNCHEK